MAQEKDERSSAAAKRPSETPEDVAKRAAGGRSTPREAGNGGESVTTSQPARRREQYLIGIRKTASAQPFGFSPASMSSIVEYLDRQERVDVVKRIKLRGAQPFAADGASNEVVVVRMEETHAERLRAAAPPYLIIERDGLLGCADLAPLPVGAAASGARLPLRSVATELTIRVIGERDQPLARAAVVLYGGDVPAEALTDDSGTARITFFGNTLEAVRAIFVRPAANHWDRWVLKPRLGGLGVNTVKLRPLSEFYPNFPSERRVGWGQQLMRLDPTGGQYAGAGVRVGLIDSGCDNTHPLLRHVGNGKGFTDGEANWNQDAVSHGTHCAGIIGAASTSQGVVGCAPEAELHVFKVFPGGRTSDLLDAIDECIERELDLIDISVVAEEFSELVSQKVQEARQKGIACIAAAGDSAGSVAFPALLPGVLAVAAVGRIREFPADSSHALTVVPQLVASDGVFAAGFSCGGPQIAVSAPGVAVISTVAGGGYAAADGTSAAAAHAAGFAALVLAHHPLFQQREFSMRSEQRVHALFELICASAMPRVADLQRGGAGVPDLQRVPGEPDIARGLSSAATAERTAPFLWSSGGQPWSALLQMRAAGLF
jgi:subtilisin family serine protease